jgi:signal peptidase I
MIFLFIVLFYMICIRIGTYGIYKKLGVAAPWKAFVPVLSSLEWQKIIGKPSWWTWMLFIPGVNLFYVASQLTEMSSSFRRFSFWEHFAAVMFAFAYIPYLGFSPNERFYYAGGVKPNEKAPQKSVIREWADAIVFAVVAATLIRVFVAEAYMIPTSSMEKTLLVGDFLFVSKFHYGARIPNTPIAMPFVHHTLPVLNTKSYTEWLKLPYKKLPGFQDVKRNDMVVFNFPAGDTVIQEFESANPYYDVIRQIATQNKVDYNTARNYVWQNFHVITRPVDKRENYIKRCVGMPGDKLELKEGVLYINDELAYQADNLYMPYTLTLGANANISSEMAKEMQIEPAPSVTQLPPNHMAEYLTNNTAKELKEKNLVSSLSFNIYPKGDNVFGDAIYPNNSKYYSWNIDNFGPIYIPAAGTTVPLNDSVYAQYARAIHVYEGNEVTQQNGKFYINGEEASTYTFKMNYYWMMGDNRHQSQDSRFWGFVPEDHLVGKAWFIWMSWDKDGESIFSKVRWKRLFSNIHGKWAPHDDKYTK